MGEAGLKLVVADLLVPGMALRAVPAAADKRHRHPLTDLEPIDLAAHRLDRARKLMAWHMRQRDVRIMPHPAMPVASAHARRLHPDHDAMGLGARIRQRDQLRRLRKGFVENGFHHGIPEQEGRSAPGLHRWT